MEIWNIGCIFSYIDCIVDRKIIKECGKVFVLLVDLNAVYNTVYREILLRLMRTNGLKELILRAIEVLHRDT